jgi:hypothetical protein
MVKQSILLIGILTVSLNAWDVFGTNVKSEDFHPYVDTYYEDIRPNHVFIQKYMVGTGANLQLNSKLNINAGIEITKVEFDKENNPMRYDNYIAPKFGFVYNKSLTFNYKYEGNDIMGKKSAFYMKYQF